MSKNYLENQYRLKPKGLSKAILKNSTEAKGEEGQNQESQENQVKEDNKQKTDEKEGDQEVKRGSVKFWDEMVTS